VDPAKTSPSVVPQLPGHVALLHQLETASAVIPPDANAQCPDGAVVVAWTLNYSNYAMGAGLECLGQCVWGNDLEDSSKAMPVPPGTIPVTSKVVGGKCMYDDPTKIIQKPKFWCNSGDVQIVTLPGGKLLHLGLCQILTSPKLESPTQACDMQQKLRDVLVFRESQDCGHTWSIVSWLDATDVSLVGPTGWSFPCTNFDRDEMHFDSSHDVVSVTVAAFAQHPLKPPGEWAAYAGLVLQSSNYGANWKVVSDEMSTQTAFVMTSSPAGWLYIFNCEGEVPTIRWLDMGPGAPKKLKSSPIRPQPWQVPVGTLCSSFTPIAGGVGWNKPQYAISHQSSARDGDWLHVAYPHVNNAYPPGPVLEARVVTFRVAPQTVDPSDPATPAVSVLEVRKLAPGNAFDSVGYLSFMQPDRLGGVSETDPASHTSLLTWLETYTVLKPTSDKPTFQTYLRQRVQVVSNAMNWSDPYDLPSDLSLEGGKVQAWTPNFGGWLGDYHNNGFAFKDAASGNLRFVVTWPQSDPHIVYPNAEVHANIVSVRPGGLP
jgi:hypothetical protein